MNQKKMEKNKPSEAFKNTLFARCFTCLNHMFHILRKNAFSIYIYGTFFNMFNSNYFTVSVAQLALINIAT